jgi:hypothetical protein
MQIRLVQGSTIFWRSTKRRGAKKHQQRIADTSVWKSNVLMTQKTCFVKFMKRWIETRVF